MNQHIALFQSRVNLLKCAESSPENHFPFHAELAGQTLQMILLGACAHDPIFAVGAASLKLCKRTQRQVKTFPMNQAPHAYKPKRSQVSNGKSRKQLSLAASHSKLWVDLYNFGSKLSQPYSCLFSRCDCNARTSRSDPQYRIKGGKTAPTVAEQLIELSVATEIPPES